MTDAKGAASTLMRGEDSSSLPEFNFSAQPHEMLGVDKGAGEHEVKNAYWAKMRIYDPNLLHPDTPKEHVEHYHKISKYINGAKNSMLRKLRKSAEDLSKASDDDVLKDYYNRKLKESLDMHDRMRQDRERMHNWNKDRLLREFDAISNYHNNEKKTMQDYYKRNPHMAENAKAYMNHVDSKIAAARDNYHSELQDAEMGHQSWMKSHADSLKNIKDYYADQMSRVGAGSKQQERKQEGYKQQERKQEGYKQQSRRVQPEPKPQAAAASASGFNFNFSARPHEMLGVAVDAGRPEIMRAYKEKVRQYHPDMNVNAPAEHQPLYHRATTAINAARSSMLGKLAKSLIDALEKAIRDREELLKKKYKI